MFTEEATKDRSGWSKHICAQIGQHGQCVLIPLDHGAHYTVSGSRQGLSTATFLGEGTAFEYSFPRRWLHRKMISDALPAFCERCFRNGLHVSYNWSYYLSSAAHHLSSNLFPCPGLLIWRLSPNLMLLRQNSLIFVEAEDVHLSWTVDISKSGSPTHLLTFMAVGEPEMDMPGPVDAVQPLQGCHALNCSELWHTCTNS